jgi:uncharacterized protein (TIGR03435 family)
MRSRAALALCAGVMFSVCAQTPPGNVQADPLVFEVASVKLSAAGCPPACGLIRSTVGSQGYHAEGATLRSLMTVAYSVTDRQISGGPAWMSSDRFDIEAKAARPRTTDELHVMLQRLLEERFNLKVRHEMREESTLALVVAKGGPKIPVHDSDDKDYAPMGLQTVKASDGGLCFATVPGHNVTMKYFAFMLSRFLNRNVVDKTGLSAHYDVNLQFAPDEVRLNGPDGRPLALSPDCADIFYALPKQLGLQLETTKAPVEYLVVEKVEKPTEN